MVIGFEMNGILRSNALICNEFYLRLSSFSSIFCYWVLNLVLEDVSCVVLSPWEAIKNKSFVHAPSCVELVLYEHPEHIFWQPWVAIRSIELGVLLFLSLFVVCLRLVFKLLNS